MDTARLSRILGAIFYDTFIVAAIIFVAAQWFPLVPEELNRNALITLFKQIYLLAIGFLYFAFSWRRGGQTIGMKAWHIRLFPGKEGTDHISWRQCAIRYSVAIISWLLAGLGFFWILFDRQRRSWHDIASGTRLMRISKLERGGKQDAA